MSEKINIGPKIVLEGEKEYRQSISNVNKSMKVLQSELKAVTAEYDGNANSLEALQAKNNLYKKQQEEQAKKLELLRGALENVSKQYGENSTQAKDWQAKLNNAYAELQKINKSLDQNEKHMKEAEQSTDKTAKSIDEYGKEVKKAKDETISFGDILKANLASEAIISGVKTLVNGMKSVVTETEEFRRDFSKLEANSKNAGAAIGDVSKELKYLDAITKETDSNIEALSNLLQAGFTGDNLSDIVSSLAGAVIKFPDTLKIEGLSDSLQETMATGKGIGQFGEMLERLGYNLDDFNERFSKTTTEAEKQQFILNTLAGSGLSKVNEEYAKNNKEMIEYSNAQYELREIMSEIAEKVTPLLTKSMGVLAENIGDIAEDVMPLFLNGFEWMVKNSDKIEAGLKGIGAALITKKAADGVIFVAQAYKTLTTATQAATTAQNAYNAASKGSVIGVIASVIIGAGTAYYNYAKSVNEAAEAISEITKQTQKEIEKRKESAKEIENEYGHIKKLTDELYLLADKENTSNSEKQKMITLVEELNKQIPDLNLNIDTYTGKLSLQKEEIEKVTDALLQQYKVQAAKENLTTIGTDIYKEEENLKDLEEERLAIVEKINEKKNDTSSITNTTHVTRYNRALEELRKSLKEQDEKIEKSKETISSLNTEWESTIKYIGEYEPIDKATNSVNDLSSAYASAGKAGEEFSKKYLKYLDDIKDKELGTLEDRQEQITDIYEKTSKQLEKRLKQDFKTFEKIKEDEIDLLEEKADKDIGIAKGVFDKKIEFINKEYALKKGLLDDEYLPELDDIQRQMDDIDNITEAEERALKTRREAEKKSELQARIDNAKTTEERIDAQKELREYQEELNRERIKEERKLNKEILSDKKETLQDEYNAKIKALEEEKKEEEKKAEDDLKAAKQIVEDKLKIAIEGLKEEQEIEREALKEKQNDYRIFLKDQKDMAIANSKAIYESDLAQYKLNQALKYEETINNEQSIKNAIQKYAYQSMQPGMARDKILYSSDLKEMLQYYNPVVPKQTVSVANGVNYGEIGPVIKQAMSEALKEFNIKMEVNGKEFGKLVDGRINYYLR